MIAILKRAVIVIGGEGVIRFANYAVVLYIARTFGAATLGSYAVILSIVTVVVMFADAGLQTIAVTQLVNGTSERNHIFGRLTFCKILLLLIAAFVLILYGAISRPGDVFLFIGAWLLLRTIIQSISQLQMAALKSISRANLIGAIQLVHGVILFTGLLLAYAFTWALTVLLGWLAAAQLLELALAALALAWSGVYPRWPDSLQLHSILKLAAPFGVAYGLANLIIRADTIILSKFVSLPELGAFSAANSLLLLVYVACWLFSSVLLPEMVRLVHQPGSLRNWSALWTRRAAVITVPGALIASYFAPRFIVALFGPAYSASGTLTAVMLLACPLILLNSIYTAFIIATNCRSLLLSLCAATAFVAFALDFAMARAYGSVGVAVAILIREAAVLAAFWLLTSHVWSAAPNYEVRSYSEGN